MRSEEDKIGGGRFVSPTADAILPPTRTYRLQGGRFVPAANAILPPVREATLQMMGIDYENAYHFGSPVRSLGRRNDE